MKVLALFIFSALASTVFGAAIGETYDQLVAEKGKPKSQMNAGNVRLVTYADAKIKLRDDVVVSITPIAIPTPSPTPPPSAEPAKSVTGLTPTPDAQKDQALVTAEVGLKNAIESVQHIVNQPVTQVAMGPNIHPTRFSPGWFPDGAITPDFATVDVRKSQQLIYDRYPYVTSDLNQNVAFIGTELEFNPMLKLFYTDRALPKKKLDEREMLQINQLYRRIAEYRKTIQALHPAPQS